ncbi:hypothetical protein CW750_08535 [Latilactobacillus sakei]|uniref:hypothetical protein n=1 Tax=Latilactobacillus sakei TaxID=1599 RepID=UPI000DCAB295|nr:hypothetical protein [Latilactobacillus sakei]AWZ43148.1 hypothetical protein CW750_08535 [Latilactobacillus sakei]
MKTIYFYDVNTKSFMYSDLIKDEVEIPVNATTIPPEADGRGMYAPTWDGEKWVELSEPDWIAKHKNDKQEPANPSDVQQAITALGLQTGNNTEIIRQLQLAITALAQNQGGK